LTATPKKDIDHNTYGLFDIEDDNPTFAYELETAVKEGYLVPQKSISVPLKFLATRPPKKSPTSLVVRRLTNGYSITIPLIKYWNI